MMLQVQLMKPLYTKREENQIIFVFAYQYFSIKKEDDLFHFIPVEGKEIIVNAQTLQVENLSDVFVFQKENRFIRLPLYQLLVVSDIHVHLQTLIEASEEEQTVGILKETEEVIHLLEQENYDRMIDYALVHHDALLFNELMSNNYF